MLIAILIKVSIKFLFGFYIRNHVISMNCKKNLLFITLSNIVHIRMKLFNL